MRHLEHASTTSFYATAAEAGTMGNPEPQPEGVRFRSFVVRGGGRSVVVDILQAGYAGEVERFWMATDGLKIQRGTSRSFLLEPLQATLATLRIAGRSAHVARALLAAPNLFRVLVRIYAEASPESTLFAGPVLAGTRTRTLSRFAPAVEVNAACGLGPMASQPLVETVVEAEALLAGGPRSLVWWLRRALQGTQLPLVTSVSTFARGMDADVDPAAQALVSPERWLGVVEEQGKPPRAESSSCADVAADIARALDAALVQRAGAWLLVDRPSRRAHTTTLSAWLYDGEADATSVSIPVPRLQTASRRLKGSLVRVPDLPDRIALVFEHGKGASLVPSTADASWALRSDVVRTTALVGEDGVSRGYPSLLVPVEPASENDPPVLASSAQVVVTAGLQVRVRHLYKCARASTAPAVRIVATHEGAPTLYAKVREGTPLLEWVDTESFVVTAWLDADTWADVSWTTEALPETSFVHIEVLIPWQADGPTPVSGHVAGLSVMAGEPDRLDAEAMAFEIAREGAPAVRPMGARTETLTLRLGSGPSAGHEGAVQLQSGVAALWWGQGTPPPSGAGQPLHLVAGAAALRALRGGRAEEEVEMQWNAPPSSIGAAFDPLVLLEDEALEALATVAHVEADVATGSTRFTGRLIRTSAEEMTITRTDLAASAVERPRRLILPPWQDIDLPTL